MLHNVFCDTLLSSR